MPDLDPMRFEARIQRLHPILPVDAESGRGRLAARYFLIQIRTRWRRPLAHPRRLNVSTRGGDGDSTQCAYDCAGHTLWKGTRTPTRPRALPVTDIRPPAMPCCVHPRSKPVTDSSIYRSTSSVSQLASWMRASSSRCCRATSSAWRCNAPGSTVLRNFTSVRMYRAISIVAAAASSR